MTAVAGTPEAWDAAYSDGEAGRSWYQAAPTMSLRMLDATGLTPADSVVDVGGGTSRLVDGLLARGHADVTVIDLSAVALELSRERLAAAADRVTWIATDLLRWRPPRRYRVWHDRAVLHFMTSEDDRAHYRAVLRAATGPGSVAVVGGFAPDGPETCSGLPVNRVDADGLAAVLGPGWVRLLDDREEHRTPWGAVQPFTWAAFRRPR